MCEQWHLKQWSFGYFKENKRGNHTGKYEYVHLNIQVRQQQQQQQQQPELILKKKSMDESADSYSY
jgi:hypothetical protein